MSAAVAIALLIGLWLWAAPDQKTLAVTRGAVGAARGAWRGAAAASTAAWAGGRAAVAQARQARQEGTDTPSRLARELVDGAHKAADRTRAARRRAPWLGGPARSAGQRDEVPPTPGGTSTQTVEQTRSTSQIQSEETTTEDVMRDKTASRVLDSDLETVGDLRRQVEAAEAAYWELMDLWERIGSWSEGLPEVLADAPFSTEALDQTVGDLSDSSDRDVARSLDQWKEALDEVMEAVRRAEELGEVVDEVMARGSVAAFVAD